MDQRIIRLSTSLFNSEKDRQPLGSDYCGICNLQRIFVDEKEQICDFCWYDFCASQEQRQKINTLDSFRDQSVRLWYTNLGVNKTTLSMLSPLTIMYILHDCFRSNDHLSAEYTLKVASSIFPESVAWLKRLSKGTLPILSLTENERIYKFSAGIDRTPIWYKVERHSSITTEGRHLWRWTPNSSHQWIQCPQLEVSFEPWVGQVPREENIFIILFLHTFGPYPPYSDPQVAQNFLVNEQMFNKVLNTLPNTTPTDANQPEYSEERNE